MQVKNRRQEKVCVSNLNFAFFKKEQKEKSKKKEINPEIRPEPYTVYPPSKIPFQLLFIHKHILYNKK